MPQSESTNPEFEAWLEDEQVMTQIEEPLVKYNSALWNYFIGGIGFLAFRSGTFNSAKQLGLGQEADGWMDIDGEAHKWFRERGLNFIKNVTETDKTALRDLLEEHWGAGERKFARKIAGEYIVSKDRAKLIYRTEIHAAHEGGSFRFASSQRAKFKQWRTVGDDRVREMHARQNQMIIAIDSAFPNGLMIPGEPNCRCTIYYFMESPHDLGKIGIKIPEHYLAEA